MAETNEDVEKTMYKDQYSDMFASTCKSDVALQTVLSKDSMMLSQFYPRPSACRLTWMRTYAKDVEIRGVRFPSASHVDSIHLIFGVKQLTWVLPMRVLKEVCQVHLNGALTEIFFPPRLLFLDETEWFTNRELGFTQLEVKTNKGEKVEVLGCIKDTKKEEKDKDVFPYKCDFIIRHMRSIQSKRFKSTNTVVFEKYSLYATGFFLFTDNAITKLKVNLNTTLTFIDYDGGLLHTACKYSYREGESTRHALWVPFEPGLSWDNVDAIKLTTIAMASFENLSVCIEPACSGTIHLLCGNILRTYQGCAAAYLETNF